MERILDWVGGGAEIPALMDGFLTEFITAACGLDLSTVLRDYTLQLVTRYLGWLPLARHRYFSLLSGVVGASACHQVFQLVTTCPGTEKFSFFSGAVGASACHQVPISAGPTCQAAVLRIRIHVFLGLLDPGPDPLVRGMDPDLDPDPSINKQK